VVAAVIRAKAQICSEMLDFALFDQETDVIFARLGRPDLRR
jgi:hypothetical protein